jgi:hypothetical protein
MTATTISWTRQRDTLLRRGLWLNYATIGYNALEAIVSLAASLVAGQRPPVRASDPHGWPR